MRFRKRAIVNAYQWHQHGDVAEVQMVPRGTAISENRREKLGWIPTAAGGHTVFPGDWVIIDEKGRLSTCNDQTFRKLYEEVDDTILVRSMRKKSA